jgi:hypothetical protein
VLVLTCAIETLTCAIFGDAVTVSMLLLTPGRSVTTTSRDVGCGFVYGSLTFAKRL